MKKTIRLLSLMMVFSSFFIVFTTKTMAAAACEEICEKNSDCSADCPVCVQDNIEAGSWGDCLTAYGSCHCKESDKSIHEGGSEVIKSYGEPLRETLQSKSTSTNTNTNTNTETPDLAKQVNTIVNYSTGIGGIIAFLLIVFGGFQIILSAGNPERVKAGKEMITSAIAGLLLIIFAVFILKLIGYDILKIPGFGG